LLDFKYIIIIIIIIRPIYKLKA